MHIQGSHNRDTITKFVMIIHLLHFGAELQRNVLGVGGFDGTPEEEIRIYAHMQLPLLQHVFNADSHLQHFFPDMRVGGSDENSYQDNDLK